MGDDGDGPGAREVDLTMVTMAFDAVDPEALQAVLARYVVVSRGHPGCRNIDLALSTTRPNRFVILQKWEQPEDQQRHFDSADMVQMATGCEGLLAEPPQIDLLDPISAHDLR
ncbi:MAG: antibiotic biosynthesis monooxygenase [Acidimicrobiales bacterium]|nr:antibiotic biosynthesis monooxygenase [Acidimicrobiales bacterium]